MKPQIEQREVLERLEARRQLFVPFGGFDACPIKLLGVRGYFLDSLGEPGQNDRGIYDDAIIICSPTAYATFLANVDPSVTRDKVAVLEPEQVVQYRPGMHRPNSASGHMAWRQDSPVIVRRDNYIRPIGFKSDEWGISLGNGLWTDRGFSDRFWINLHRGGRNTTSSLGCQTIQLSDWTSFYLLLKREQQVHNVPVVHYCLTQDPRMS